MKKVILVAFSCLLANADTLYSQYKDKTALAKEMDRVNRMVDSMRPILAARDSASRARLEEISRSSSRITEELKQKETEQATTQVIKQIEKDRQRRRNTKLLAGLATIVITAIVVAVIRSRKKYSQHRD